jgi:RNA polymerase sigma-70 factor (ECF subfamily)
VPIADDRLLAAVAAGDEAAFVQLYRQHTPRLFAVVLRMLGRCSDAEDAVQEAWLRAVRGLPAFRGDSSFLTWLTGIGIRCALEIIRKRLPLALSEVEGLALSEVEGADTSHAPDLALDLERAIAELPDGYRVVLVLHDVEGFTHEEIGRLLEVEPGTSKSQLFHARRALRLRLRPELRGVST